MAEQTPAVQNKGMLIVAAVLGIGVVLIYNWQIEAIRKEGRGEQVYIMRFEKDMVPGQKLDVDKDLAMEAVPEKLADRLADVVAVKNKEGLRAFKDLPVNKRIYKGVFLTSSMLSTDQKMTRLRLNNPQDLAVAVSVKEQGIGDVLQPGSYVNLVANIPDRSGKLTPMRVLKRVFVLAVGGRGIRSEASPMASAEEGSASYRTLTIEVSDETSLDLKKVQGVIGGPMEVEGLSESVSTVPGEGKIPPEVMDIVKAAAAAGGGATSPLRPGGG